MGDGIHEKEIDAQNAKMSGLNQHKYENVGLSAVRRLFAVLILISFCFI